MIFRLFISNPSRLFPRYRLDKLGEETRIEEILTEIPRQIYFDKIFTQKGDVFG